MINERYIFKTCFYMHSEISNNLNFILVKNIKNYD